MRLLLFLSSSLLFNIAAQYINAPYRWNTNGPFEFDCSGLVVRSIREYYTLTNKKHEAENFIDKTAQGLHDWQLKKGMACEPPSEGCLLYYGFSVTNITHVQIMGPKNIIVEAGGAGSETKAMGSEQLISYCAGKDARVRYRNYGNRKDLVASIRFDVK